MDNELTVRMAAYSKGTLLQYDEAELEGVERELRRFVEELDKRATQVRITLFNDERKVTAWNSPVDEYFEEWMESLIDELIEERFMFEVEHGGEL